MPNKRIAVVICLFLFPLTCSGKTITIAADEWPPFNNAATGEDEGYMIKVAREIFEAVGYRFVYKNVPWTRALTEARKGSYTGVVGASKTDAAGFVFPSEELARNLLAFYVLKGRDWTFDGVDSLSSMVIATIAGYDYRAWLNDYIQEYSDDPARVQINYGSTPLERNLKMLILGRVDVVVDTESTIRYAAKKMGVMDRIRPGGYGKEVAYIYMAFSPNIPESEVYARILSQGIVQMRRNGRLAQILQDYGLTDWKR